MRFVASSWPIFHNELLQVLMQRWVGQFRDIFDQDNYHPISVSSSLEWRDVTASFPYESPSLEASPFPKHFPFSAMVPRFGNQSEELIFSGMNILFQGLHRSAGVHHLMPAVQ